MTKKQCKSQPKIEIYIKHEKKLSYSCKTNLTSRVTINYKMTLLTSTISQQNNLS